MATPIMKRGSQATRVLLALARKSDDELMLGRRLKIGRDRVLKTTSYLRARGLLHFSGDAYHLTEDGWSAAQSMGARRPLERWAADNLPRLAWSSP